MRFVRSLGLIPFLCLAALVVRAQDTVPTLTQGLPAQTLTGGGATATVDLHNYFGLPGVTRQVVQIVTTLGKFNVELFSDVAPKNAANFMNYVNRGAYNVTFVHRTPPGFVVQMGGYAVYNGTIIHIPVDPAVQNEFKISNTRGTVAFAKIGGDPNSATSEFFVNLTDNSANLDTQNSGFTVFARVLGTGMKVPDAIDALFDLQNVTVGALVNDDYLPVLPLTTGQTGYDDSNLVYLNSVSPIVVYPTSDTSVASVLSFTATSSNTGVATAALSGSALTVTPVAAGSTSITVRATDTNGSSVTGSFTVTVGTASAAPQFTTQPAGQTAATGMTVAFNAVASGSPGYQWYHGGSAISGATTSTLILRNIAAGDAGDYYAIGKNSTGSAQSTTATLTLVNANATELGRLVNLSILATAGPTKVLTLGATVGGGNGSAALPLVIRGVGPALASFGVPTGYLADPSLTINPAGNSTPLGSNDNWDGTTATANAFTSVGAFPLGAGSLDAAYVALSPGFAPGGYTVAVTGKSGSASGTVLAEIYDASNSTGARTAATPRLTNLSTLSSIDTGTTLTTGFVITGSTSRTVLIRAVGPSLAVAPFNIGGTMSDPRLELFNNDTGQKIAENDDWGGDTSLANAQASVGAFALAGATTKDAVILITLPPHAYSARVSANGNGGTAIVEVYEIP